MGKFYLTSYKDVVSIADVLEIYADLYDVFENNREIKKELDKVCDRLIELHSNSAQPYFDITAKIDKAYDDGYEAGYLQGMHDWGDLDE